MTNNKRRPIKEVFSKDFIKGFETAIQMCKNIAKREGLELYIPDINEIVAEHENSNNKQRGRH